MKFEIKNRFTGQLIFECEAGSWRVATELAIEKKANLRFANLHSADLRFADLRSADLSSADLSSADLRSANLHSADLRFADLSSADLRSADLSSADLRSANLRFADLRFADLRSADLRSADLRSADLREIKEDFFNKLTIAKAEVIGLYKALVDGRIDGTCYQGECACFVGTIAKVRGVHYEKMTDLVADSSSPIERWFYGILKGETPESNQVAAITKQWLEEFMKENSIQAPRRKIVWSD